jgi:hypothetical protein
VGTVGPSGGGEQPQKRGETVWIAAELGGNVDPRQVLAQHRVDALEVVGNPLRGVATGHARVWKVVSSIRGIYECVQGTDVEAAHDSTNQALDGADGRKKGALEAFFDLGHGGPAEPTVGPRQGRCD